MWRKKKEEEGVRCITTDHAWRQHVVQVLQESLIFDLIISEDEGNSVPITTCCAVQVPEVIQQIGHIVRPAGEQGCKSKVKVNSCIWVNWEVWVGGQGWGNAQPMNIQNRMTQLLQPMNIQNWTTTFVPHEHLKQNNTTSVRTSDFPLKNRPNLINMPDLTWKHFGYGQLWLLWPACSQNCARSYMPDLTSHNQLQKRPRSHCAKLIWI